MMYAREMTPGTVFRVTETSSEYRMLELLEATEPTEPFGPGLVRVAYELVRDPSYTGEISTRYNRRYFTE